MEERPCSQKTCENCGERDELLLFESVRVFMGSVRETRITCFSCYYHKYF
jgi:hypothetical protein